MNIFKASISDIQTIAEVIRLSNLDVAEKFNLTLHNNPKHPSFYTKKWALLDIQRGEEFFLYQKDNLITGCVAYEQPDKHTAYLNRLSVLPEHRCQGIGQKLVEYIIEYARSKQVREISIGIIAKHDTLKKWYSKLGFVENGIKQFDHLPFDVMYMKYLIK